MGHVEPQSPVLSQSTKSSSLVPPQLPKEGATFLLSPIRSRERLALKTSGSVILTSADISCKLQAAPHTDLGLLKAMCQHLNSMDGTAES